MALYGFRIPEQIQICILSAGLRGLAFAASSPASFALSATLLSMCWAKGRMLLPERVCATPLCFACDSLFGAIALRLRTMCATRLFSRISRPPSGTRCRLAYGAIGLCAHSVAHARRPQRLTFCRVFFASQSSESFHRSRHHLAWSLARTQDKRCSTAEVDLHRGYIDDI